MIAGLWAGFRTWPLARRVGAGLAIITLIGCAVALFMFFLDRKDARLVEQSETAGRAKVEAKISVETIKKVEKANAAKNAVRVRDDAWHVECLRHARNPADCG